MVTLDLVGWKQDDVGVDRCAKVQGPARPAPT
jgi:hypothetical protein